MNFIQKIFRSFKRTAPVTPYLIIGEHKGIIDLVENFYNIMQTDPKAIDCLKTHPLTDGKISGLTKEKFSDFLCGWLGGENLFVQKYGHPRMRARHIKFKIGDTEKEQWLYCMSLALDMHSPKLKKKHKKLILDSCHALAIRIQNH